VNPLRIYSISDQALTIAFSEVISEAANQQVLQLHHRLQAAPFMGFIESVPAYGSLTVYFSAQTNKEEVTTQLNTLLSEFTEDETLETGEMHKHIVPVCYEGAYGADLQAVASATGLSIQEIIEIHTGMTFRVFMIGFVPGFAYMGILPPELEMPRRQSPRLEVPAGSVAIAGRQTGIYPAVIPGGWHIIGRTPWRLFDKNAQPCSRLSAGDLVQFEAITTEAFEQLS
jgi:inhibitor of KinA